MPRSFAIGRSTLELVVGDVTRETTDAIVNAANATLLGGGGVDGAIHRAAGPALQDACRAVKKKLPGGLLRTGGAVITAGFRLPARHVVHCVGPVYAPEGERAPVLLAACYKESLSLARAHDLRSIAFPSISTGAYGYPVEEAAPLAIRAVAEDLAQHGAPELVRFVLFDEPTYRAYVAAAESRFGPRPTLPPEALPDVPHAATPPAPAVAPKKGKGKRSS